MYIKSGPANVQNVWCAWLTTFLLETHIKTVGGPVFIFWTVNEYAEFNEICIWPSWTQLTSDSTEVKIWVLLIPDIIPGPPSCTFLNRKSFYKLKAEDSFPTCPEECGSEIRLSSEMLQVYRERCYQLSAWLWVSHCLFTLSAIISGDLMASGKPGV